MGAANDTPNKKYRNTVVMFRVLLLHVVYVSYSIDEADRTGRNLFYNIEIFYMLS